MNETLSQDLDVMRRTKTSHPLTGSISSCLLLHLYSFVWQPFLESLPHPRVPSEALWCFSFSCFSLFLLRDYEDRDWVLFISVSPLLPCALGNKVFNGERNRWVAKNSSTSRSENCIFSPCCLKSHHASLQRKRRLCGLLAEHLA